MSASGENHTFVKKRKGRARRTVTIVDVGAVVAQPFALLFFGLMMTLKSAFEDLTGTTLKAISGILGRLDYVSELRASGASYQHWGLARVHGEMAAHQALAAAHRSLVSQVLRTPLRNLLDDAETCSSAKGVTPSAYLENLRNRASGLLPPNPAGASARHLNSVLHALSSLAATRRHSIPPA